MAVIAAVSDPFSVDFIVSMSGPGVAVHEQDRYRIEVALRSADLPPSDVDDALAWIDERTRRLLDGESIDAIIDEQQRLADRPWAPIALEFFDHPATLRFLSRILAFDPVPFLSRLSCPVLAILGAADTLVPVAASVAAFAEHLPRLPGDPSGLAAFPGANHGLFTADPIDGVDRTSQLAPGFLAMVAGLLAQVGSGA